MDGYVYDVVVGIEDADHLLVTVARRHTYQSAKSSDTEIHVYDEIARCHLLQLLHGECHLASTGRVGTQVVLVVTVENLMVGEEACLLLVVNESLVDGLVYGLELYLIFLQFLAGEDVLESLLLLLAVG